MNSLLTPKCQVIQGQVRDLGPRSIFHDFERFIDSLFFDWPADPKPPIAINEYTSNEKEINICMAVAGFTKDDIKVYIDNNVLYIEGNNEYNKEIPDKFKCNFKRQFPCRHNLDIKTAAVKLLNGILTVHIPLVEPESSRTYIFGKK